MFVSIKGAKPRRYTVLSKRSDPACSLYVHASCEALAVCRKVAVPVPDSYSWQDFCSQVGPSRVAARWLYSNINFQRNRLQHQRLALFQSTKVLPLTDQWLTGANQAQTERSTKHTACLGKCDVPCAPP